MALYINTNVASQLAQKNLSNAQSMLANSFNKLSSGYRINGAADDAAGLAISDSMQSQIRSYTVAERNANDGISMAQTADGALGSITDIVGRMRELAMQGSNGSLQTSDRTYLQTEFGQLQSEIKRIMTSTKFNGQQLIQSGASAITFQVGIGNTAADRISVSFGGSGLSALVSTATLVSGSSGSNAQASLDTIDAALKNISTARARYGAVENRFQTVTSNIETVRLNLSAANSRIRDVDVASETAALSREQVLVQAGTSVLAQANQSPQAALSLLR